MNLQDLQELRHNVRHGTSHIERWLKHVEDEPGAVLEMWNGIIRISEAIFKFEGVMKDVEIEKPEPSVPVEDS